MPRNDHIEDRDGRYYIRRSQVPISDLVRAWNEGTSPEDILRHVPTLALVDVYAAITFYLDHRDQVDAYMRADTADQATLEEERLALAERTSEWARRMAAFRAVQTD